MNHLIVFENQCKFNVGCSIRFSTQVSTTFSVTKSYALRKGSIEEEKEHSILMTFCFTRSKNPEWYFFSLVSTLTGAYFSGRSWYSALFLVERLLELQSHGGRASETKHKQKRKSPIIEWAQHPKWFVCPSGPSPSSPTSILSSFHIVIMNSSRQ